MKLFDKFNQTFGFTPIESRVVIFLLASFVAGMGIRLIKSTASGESSFDYSASDSEFAARSRQLTMEDSSSVDAEQAESPESKPKQRARATASKELQPESINLNSATKDELIKLPGIGEAMAERIMLYREEHGPFDSVEELTNIKGIGKKKLERISPYCTVKK